MLLIFLQVREFIFGISVCIHWVTVLSLSSLQKLRKQIYLQNSGLFSLGFDIGEGVK